MERCRHDQRDVAKVAMVFGVKKTGTFEGESVEFHEFRINEFQIRTRIVDGRMQTKVRWYPHRAFPYLVQRNWIIFNRPKFKELLELLEPYFHDHRLAELGQAM